MTDRYYYGLWPISKLFGIATPGQVIRRSLKETDSQVAWFSNSLVAILFLPFENQTAKNVQFWSVSSIKISGIWIPKVHYTYPWPTSRISPLFRLIQLQSFRNVQFMIAGNIICYLFQLILPICWPSCRVGPRKFRLVWAAWKIK